MPRPPEWRFDPRCGRLVLLSPEREAKPDCIDQHNCPFCQNHESETEPEVLAYRPDSFTPNSTGWIVRVFPNKYAAIRPPLGQAEVIVDCPHHETRFHQLPSEHMALTLMAWRDRLSWYRLQGKYPFVQLFKNQGPQAGASVAHCHSQLIASQKIPDFVQRELRHHSELFKKFGQCPLCQELRQQETQTRWIFENSDFVAICPIAPRQAFETWIIPKRCSGHFETLHSKELLTLAEILRILLVRIQKAADQPDYNLILVTTPQTWEHPFHWRLEILPRIVNGGGWEWATETIITTVLPEDAAERLRRMSDISI